MCFMTHRGREVRCWLEVTTTICKTGMKCTGEPKFLKYMDNGLPSQHGPVVHFPCTSIGMESELLPSCWLNWLVCSCDQLMWSGAVLLFPKSNHHFREGFFLAR